MKPTHPPPSTLRVLARAPETALAGPGPVCQVHLNGRTRPGVVPVLFDFERAF